ncbi:MAG: hypothetical protein K6U74_12110, partial [Firmicutes bacterium]|nr:hypothetical protein [Bacillota bacterium]
MRIWLVLFFALILTVTAGCGRKEPPETQMPPSGPGIAMPIQPSAVDFDKVQEVTPTGDLPKAIHKDFQPALASVFGGAKLSGFFAMGGQMNLDGDADRCILV